MTAPPGDSENVTVARVQALVARLRKALVAPLTEGNWEQIRADHAKVGLAWRPELKPGWGKVKYVGPVLDDLPDEVVVALGRRTIELFPDRCGFDVEDALLWIDAGGEASVTQVTRIALATVFDRRRLHPRASTSEVLGRFAHSTDHRRFEHLGDGSLVVRDGSPFLSAAEEPVSKSDPLDMLDAYRFREWPDAKLFAFLEFLVDPSVRQGDEQGSLVRDLNEKLAPDGFELAAHAEVSGHPVFKVRPLRAGVTGRPKNLIFASIGPKPEIGFADAVNNDIAILANGEYCLVYDAPIGADGLTMAALLTWWAAREGLDPNEPSTQARFLTRLRKSLASPPEHRFFDAYLNTQRKRFARGVLPALVPQVYLHYDPIALRELRARGQERRFEVQRMDFLMLLPHGVRVVVEVDGQQHYSTGVASNSRPSPKEYARMARADRQLRLAGYEVYRFGGYELGDDAPYGNMVDDFFTRLFRRHKISLSNP